MVGKHTSSSTSSLSNSSKLVSWSSGGAGGGCSGCSLTTFPGDVPEEVSREVSQNRGEFPQELSGQF